ncbi:MAG: hypothetical protein JJU02_15435 [Cryomorphaceae bacterium]|nr:hypothetical protein [Cryomorphaceae bacterium]
MFSFFLLAGCVPNEINCEEKFLQYDQISSQKFSLPYIYAVNSDSSLFVYGTYHTFNPKDDQISEITAIARKIRPDVIFYEGDGISFIKGDISETISTYGEMGYAVFLADSLGIDAKNLEPPTREKYEYLTQRFSNEEVFLATLGLQITYWKHQNLNFDTYYKIAVRDLAEEGFPVTPEMMNAEYFRAIFERVFQKPFSYEAFESANFQANETNTVYNKVNQTANKYRDLHMVRVITETVDQGHEVLVVVGGWHAAVIAPYFSCYY